MDKVDLRVFGAIGLQDTWLAKHTLVSCGQKGYHTPSEFFATLIERCFEEKLGLCALTTEDDRVAQGYPEDRFGYLLTQVPQLRDAYHIQRLGENTLVFRRTHKDNGPQHKVIIINAQTVHPREGKHEKYQVIGTNQIPNGLPLAEGEAYCNSRGIPHFKLRSNFFGYSSAHFLSDVGRSYSLFPAHVFEERSEADIMHKLKTELPISAVCHPESPFKKALWMGMLQFWGRSADRFKGCKSSYNLPSTATFYNYT